MNSFDEKFFKKFTFTKEQITNNISNAKRDYEIAKNDVYLEVRSSYAYNALIKAGIALLSKKGLRVRSVPGHHVKIIESLAEILKDEEIKIIGEQMRGKRNTGFYFGGSEITEKECEEYLDFVGSIIKRLTA